MNRVMVWVALAALMAVGCGKKSEETASQETAKPGEAPAGKTCDKGQLLQGSECVAILTPEKISAVQTQVSKLEAIEAKLDKVEKLTAVIELMNALRQLDAWKKAAATSDKFKKVDEMVANLKQGADSLKAFNAQLKDSKLKLADLGATLQKLYDGSGAAKTLGDAKGLVSGEIRGAIEPLQAKVAEAITAIGPALGELAKLKDIITGVCAMGALYGAGADFKSLCDTGKDAFDGALSFLEEHKDAPKLLLGDLVTQLETELDALLDAEAKKLMDSAEAAVKGALGEAKP